MDNIKQIVLQEMNESRYSRHHIDSYIRDFILENYENKIEEGVELVEKYKNTSYYDSKNVRIAQLNVFETSKVVLNIYVGIAYCLKEELFTSISAQIASRLLLSDKKDSIATVAELIAVLCSTDMFDIGKSNKQASLMVLSRLALPSDLIKCIENSHYMPPMVCEPLELTSNYSSGYLSHKDSLILGKGNHHEGDLCLDVLNIMNKTCLRLDTAYLCTVEEDPNTEFTLEWAHDKALEKGKIISDVQAKIDVDKAIKNWMLFKEQGYEVYKLLTKQGNEFYMTHKVDKRGRIYSQGYHINPQGAAFKKSLCELAHEEFIEGMP